MSKLLAVLACSLMLASAGCDRIFSREPDFSRGGSYLLLQVDREALLRDHLEAVADEMADALRASSIRFAGHGVLGDAARVQLADVADRERALPALAAMPNAALYRLSASEKFIEARLSEVALRERVNAALEESVAVLGRRMDPRQPVEITRTGDDLLRIRMPAGTNVAEVRARATPTAKLTFHLVREVSPVEAAVGELPPNSFVAQPFPGVGDQAEVVERRPRLSGEHLERATPSTDSYTGEFLLAFQLNAEGARRFCRITTDHTGERFAILLDGRVLTAPRVNEPICGGSGQISGNFTAETVRDLAAVLSAGALPAPLIVVDEGPIGPSALD
jgi:protein-export membrane protein SecD